MSRFTKMEQSWLTRIGIPMENMNFPFLIKKEIRQKLQMESRSAIREEDGDIVYDSRHDLMLYQKEESERIGIGIVDFWYADEMKTEQNFRLDW